MPQRLLLVSVFLVSGIVAALITYHPLSTSAQSTESAIGLPSSSYLGASTIALPSALVTQRPVPLRNASSVTRWAPVLRTTVARRRPNFYSAPLGVIPARTPEGTTNLVVADDEVVSRGVVWVRVPLAVLPNGIEGWVPRSSLGGWSFVDTSLVINRARLIATLLRAGRAIFRARVGIGAPGTPTPAGTFYVRDRLTRFADRFYGPIAFGTNARSPTLTDWPAGGFIGIHGTDQPDLIPGRVSHGCIRMTNASILRLAELMPIGTPVTIT